MGKKDTTATEQTALAVSTPAALALADADLHTAINGLEDVDDGLTELEAKDVKLPTKVWNFKGIDSRGEPIAPNVFYDTVTEECSRTVDLMLIKLHKTNEWREFNQTTKKNEVRCRSFDRLKGEMTADGLIRPCQGCPDAKWTTENGKRNRRCGEVWNIFAADLVTMQPCVLRFRRTSLPVIQAHINKHHTGKRMVGNKRTNWPLWSFRVAASLKMIGDDVKYALPVLEKLGNVTAEQFELGRATVPYVNDVLLGELRKVVDTADVGGEGDTSFDTEKMGGDKFAADEGQAFVEGA
jgi:hypothetical protein